MEWSTFGYAIRLLQQVSKRPSVTAKCSTRVFTVSSESVDVLRADRNVWSAASPQAKCEDVTSWSAQMYSAFVGVNHSWPGWNALRSFPHLLCSLKRLLPFTCLKRAGFDRCAISSFASRPGKKSFSLQSSLSCSYISHH